MKVIGIIEEIERLKELDKNHLINELIHAKVEISYLKAINSNEELVSSLRKHLIDEHSQNEKIINELKSCNSDYYNLINTLSSKLARIRKKLEEVNEFCLSFGLKTTLLKIIDDKNIKIGSDED